MTRLGDLCEFRYGKSLPAQSRREGPIPVYGSNGVVGWHDEAITNGKTIVIGRKGSIGEINVSADSCWPIDTTYYIDADATEVDIGWLSGALSSLRLSELNKAAAVPGLNRGDAYEKRLFVPRLDEQRRIAAILDKADALRQKRKRAITLLDSLTQSIFLEMFGDPKHNPLGFREVSLGAVADFFAGNSLPAGESYSGQADGYLLLKVSDMNLPGNEEMINYSAAWSAAPGSKASTCPTNAIVFPKRGGAISTNKKRRLSRPAILDPNVMGVYPRLGMLHEEYLFSWFQKLDLTEISSGSSVPQLNKQDLAPLMIAMPDMALQQDFAVRLERIRPNRQAAGTALAASEALFATLQHRAFSGQL